ncbi:MAG TPA: LysR family transcriptional regulator [Acidimicrobiales bacterium]|jgi:DNA-binding transcriptional LysR family regulator
MLSTYDLHVFATIAEEGSFSRSATRLHLAQPSISDKVARLERQLGTALFVRNNRGVQLTGAGRRLLPYAQRCVSLTEDAVRAVKANDAEMTYRVLMHSSFAPTIMPFLIDVLAEFPLELSNNDAHSEHVVEAVADGAADIGFTIAVPHPHNVRLEPFYADPVVCVADCDHPLAEARELEVADLVGHTLAVNVWGDGADRFVEMLRSAPIAATALRPVSPAETAAALARHRGHIAVCTRSTVSLDLADGRLVELPVVDLPRWLVRVFLVVRDEPARDAPTEAVRAAVAEVYTSEDSQLYGR